MPFALTAVLLALGAETVPVRVLYDAPSECPSAQEFYDDVRARTDHVRPALPDESHMDISVRVTHGAHGYTGEVRELVNDKESAVRAMDGGTCKEVVEALSLTVALSIDPDAHTPTQAPAPVVALPPAPIGPRAAPPNNADLPRIRLELSLGVLGTVVDTSGASFGGLLAIALRREVSADTSRSLELALVFASTGLPSSPADHRTRFGALALTGCPWRHRFGQAELAPCALGMFGVLDVTGRDIPNARTVDRAWWSAGLDVHAAWELGAGFTLEGALGASLPLVRRRFFTNGSEHVVAETPAISPLAQLAVGYRF